MNLQHVSHNRHYEDYVLLTIKKLCAILKIGKFKIIIPKLHPKLCLFFRLAMFINRKFVLD